MWAVDGATDATILELRAADAPGLLYRVAPRWPAGADVRAARISTLGADVVDAFYLAADWSTARARRRAAVLAAALPLPAASTALSAAVASGLLRRPPDVTLRAGTCERARAVMASARAYPADAARTACHPDSRGRCAVFDTLSDRLSGIFTKLRGKGRLTDADIDATAREIRLALLEADVALPVVKAFIARLKERARGAEVSPGAQPGPADHQDRARGAGRASSAARRGGCSSPSSRRP